MADKIPKAAIIPVCWMKTRSDVRKDRNPIMVVRPARQMGTITSTRDERRLSSPVPPALTTSLYLCSKWMA